MWPYWTLFLLPALGALAARGSAVQAAPTGERLAWAALLGVLVIAIGFRFEVGGDWHAYSAHLRSMRHFDMVSVMARSDPGYYFLNWIVHRAGGSILWVNTACAGLVVWGAAHFARHQPLPWLAMTVALPYLVIVVAMGYTRQGAALGLALAGLAALGQQRTRRFVILVLCGSLFHSSAVLLLPIAALAATRRRLWTTLWVGVVAASGAYLLVADSAGDLWQNYVAADYQSQGGLIRVAMNAVPSLLLLVYRNYLFYGDEEKRLWLWMSALSLLTLPLVLLSSTAVDRVALYFIPLQMFAFARLPLLASSARSYNLVVLAVVGYYALVLFVWLNYASHAFAWLPYRNFLFLS
jgi:hypothetical protein